ncbi:unnamed protein product [Aureobasidium uvarum]|uniref:Uncharacterized protein n=1 Tax=Aureobasidium uvarum TaxID=2773716 RepID=A0A9N8KHX8_9PEZI|nr:unnamed protein product [Aureobasidium uvarum]
MNTSPLSRLPLELHEQIFDYTMATNVQHINDCGREYNSGVLTKSMMTELTRRHAFMATCRELQGLGLRLCLRLTEFIWDCSSEQTSRNIMKAIDTRVWDGGAIFHTLPDLQTQGCVSSIRGAGAVSSDDYLHRESWKVKGPSFAKVYANWVDKPLEVLIMYQRAACITCRLRTEQHQRELDHHQLFYRHSYRLQTFTDGNAARPIKKALRGTWKRDTISLTINMLNEATSLQRMEAVMSLLDSEHHKKVQAIKKEIEKEVQLYAENGDVDFGDVRPMYEQFVHDMNLKYSLWRQRVKKFHEGLIKVIMLSYRADYHALADALFEMRHDFEQMLPHEYTGDQVVNSVVELVRATTLQKMEPRYRIESDLWLDSRNS